MHPDCIHNQSGLDQRKERRELPRSLHVYGHGATKTKLTKVVKPGRTLPPRRRTTAVAPWMGSRLQILITLILNRCRPARPLSHRACVFQVTVSLRPTDGLGSE